MKTKPNQENAVLPSLLAVWIISAIFLVSSLVQFTRDCHLTFIFINYFLGELDNYLSVNVGWQFFVNDIRFGTKKMTLSI